MKQWKEDKKKIKKDEKYRKLKKSKQYIKNKEYGIPSK